MYYCEQRFIEFIQQLKKGNEDGSTRISNTCSIHQCARRFATYGSCAEELLEKLFIFLIEFSDGSELIRLRLR